MPEPYSRQLLMYSCMARNEIDLAEFLLDDRLLMAESSPSFS